MGILSKVKPKGPSTKPDSNFVKPQPPLKYKPTKNIKPLCKVLMDASDTLQKLIRKDGPTQQSLRMFAAVWRLKSTVSLLENLDQQKWNPNRVISIPVFYLNTGDKGDSLLGAQIKALAKHAEAEEKPHGALSKAKERIPATRLIPVITTVDNERRPRRRK